MQYTVTEDHINVVLSERNLRALLSKLEWKDSLRTIVHSDGGLSVTAESDSEHYGDREPGPMHPLTESALADEVIKVGSLIKYRPHHRAYEVEWISPDGKMATIKDPVDPGRRVPTEWHTIVRLSEWSLA